MGLRIILSSALDIDEKAEVKQWIREMKDRGLMDIASVYDCEEHHTETDKQRRQVDPAIRSADWLICLTPQDFVGHYTVEEIETAYEVRRSGHPLVIQIFHAIQLPDAQRLQPDPARHVSFADLMQRVQQLEGSDHDQYAVNYVFDDHRQHLRQALYQQYTACYHRDRAFFSQRLQSAAQPGAEVLPKQLFFDPARAEAKNGFDEHRYIRRQSVDEKLRQELDDPNRHFIFITGKPTSGKSRAMLECCHSVLRDQSIVVLRKDNAADVCRKLLVEVGMQREMEEGTWTVEPAGTPFRQHTYYFFADQIYDVFRTVDGQLLSTFLQAIRDCTNCRLVGSSTQSTLKDFLDEHPEVFDSTDDQADYVEISIPPVNKDDPEVLVRLREFYAADNGETIGDFIPSLNNYKERIAKEVVAKTRTPGYELLPELLQSMQTVAVFRKSNPLLLAFCVLRELAEDAGKENALTPKKVAQCLNLLIRKNLVWLTETPGCSHVLAADGTLKWKAIEDFDTDETLEYDGEEYPNLISSSCVFSFNELLWEHLQQRNNELDQELLFNIYDPKDIKRSASYFYKIYPHAANLARVVSRVPHRPGTSDRRDFAEREHAVWEYVRARAKLKLQSESVPEDVVQVYNMLIGRAWTVDEVRELLKEMEERGLAANDTTVGEMFRFANRRLERGSEEFRSFVRFCYQLNQQQQSHSNTPWTFDDIYRIEREIALVYTNYKEAEEHARNIIRRIVSLDLNEQGRPLTGYEAVKAECAKDNTLHKMNIGRLLISLASLCREAKDVASLLVLHRDCGLPPSTTTLHRIAHLIRSEKEIDNLLGAVFPDVAAEHANKELFERYVVTIVQHLTTFATSKALYERYFKVFGSTTHNPRIISMCLQNCRREEFQDAAAFVCSLPPTATNGITFNNLLANAPNIDDAIFVLRRMPPTGMDEFTLSICLKLVSNFRQSKNDNDTYGINQGFLFAYEFINHPLLSKFRTSYACLQRLYDLTNTKAQEEYIDRLLTTPTGNRNEYFLLFFDNRINTTRINKRYRSFLQAYEDIYLPAYAKLSQLKGKVQPDLFSAICSKAEAEDARGKAKNNPAVAKALEDIAANIRQRLDAGTLIEDGYFFFNYHIKFCSQPLFTEDGTHMSPLFMQWFHGKVGNADLMQANLITRILTWIYYRKHVTGDWKWTRMRTLYEFYSKAFNSLRQPFCPQDKAFTVMIQTAANSSAPADNLKYLDKELCRLSIERTPPLHSTLMRVEKETGTQFDYDQQQPPVYNRHAVNLNRIQSAYFTQRILNILREEVERVGFVTPSLITAALERFREFQRVHAFTLKDMTEKLQNLIRKLSKYNGDRAQAWKKVNMEQMRANYLELRKDVRRPYGSLILPEEDKMVNLLVERWSLCTDVAMLKQTANEAKSELDAREYEELTDFISDNQLQGSLTQRAYALLALLAPTHELRSQWLQIYDSLAANSINEISLGQLATEMVIGTYDIRSSRRYFQQWLQIYMDLYPDLSVRCARFPKKKWTTLGLHLNQELHYLTRLRHTRGLDSAALDEFCLQCQADVVPTLEAIDCILTHYALSPFCWPEDNFRAGLSLGDVFQMLHHAFPDSDARLSELHRAVESVEARRLTAPCV